MKPRNFGLITLILTRGRNGSLAEKFSLSKMICAVFVFCAATAIASPSQTLTTLASFDLSNGALPAAPLIQGTDGNFYGTTEVGGNPGNNGFCSDLTGTPGGCGTVFKVTPAGALATLYRFCAQSNCLDGSQPSAALVQGPDGNFYGTTVEGGANDINCPNAGCGTVFKITPSGTLTTLYSFCSLPGCADGVSPFGTLILATDGNFYGTTAGGGGYEYAGTVFKITPQGVLTTLHTFNFYDGEEPYAGLVQAADGSFYGTTADGGTYYSGTVFKVTPAGVFTTLHNFDGTDGDLVEAGLIQATDGNFYGTTSSGGASQIWGTVFKITPGGALTTLYNFCLQANCPDGFSPQALVQATDGNLYGTTAGGGTAGGLCISGCGTIFRITTAGALTTLHNFDVTDGDGPYAALLQATDGKLYGTTIGGGSSSECDYGCGTVFSFNVGLAPFVETQPTFGGVGAPVTILGTNLTGTTSVSFNGTPATFNVVSADDTVTVIDGATLSTTTVQIGQYTEPTTIKVNEIADKIWVLDYNANSVTVIDGTTLSTTAVPVGQNPVDLAINRSTNKVFVTIYDYIYGNTVTVIDGVTLSTTSVNVGIDPYFVAVNEATNQIYVTHSLVDGVLTIIDGATLSTSSVPAGPGPSELAVDGVRNKIYVINAVNQYHMVTVIDGSDHSRTAVRVGIAPVALVINQVTNRIYVSNEQDNTVSVIDGTPPTPLQFVPLAEPCRAVDTRPQYGGGGPILGGTFQNFPIQQEGNCNIPASAAAYSMNVSVVPQGPLSYLTVWPAGQPQPLASTLNSLDGRIKANAAIIPAGANREISVYATNTTNVIVDVNGYFAPVTDSTLAFYPLPPCRVADTRYPNGSGLGSPYLTGGQERDFPILNATSCNIPSTAAAYSLNFSVVPHGPLGYMTVWQTGESRPTVSTLNDIPGTIIANAAVVAAGTGGEVAVYPTNDTDLIIDINGYFAAPGAGGLSLYGVQPCRVIDTRKVGAGQPFSGTLSPPVDVVDSGCGTSSLAQAYVFNASVVPYGALGYLTLWPDDGSQQPVVSTLNALDGSISSNMAIVPTGTNGSVNAYASGTTQLILDISSYFAP